MQGDLFEKGPTLLVIWSQTANTCDYCYHAFCHAVPTIWNSLAADLTDNFNNMLLSAASKRISTNFRLQNCVFAMPVQWRNVSNRRLGRTVILPSQKSWDASCLLITPIFIAPPDCCRGTPPLPPRLTTLLYQLHHWIDWTVGHIRECRVAVSVKCQRSCHQH